MFANGQPYEVVNTPMGTAVLLDPERAYSTPVGRKLIVTDRATRSTLAAIDGATPEGHWAEGPRIEIEFRDCICGKC